LILGPIHSTTDSQRAEARWESARPVFDAQSPASPSPSAPWPAALRFPQHVRLHGAQLEEARAVIAALDPAHRLGRPPRPLFLTARVDRSCAPAVPFLGLTEANADWLASMAGAAFAEAACHRLDRLFDGHDRPPSADYAEHAVLALVATARRTPQAPIRVSVMPCPFGADSGSGLAYSADPVSGRPGVTGTFRRNATGSQLLTNGGEVLTASTGGPPWTAELSAAMAVAQDHLGQIARAAFVVDSGTLWMLDVRPADLSGAALIAATRARWQRGELTGDEALATVSERDLSLALAPDDSAAGLPAVAHGVGVSPGTIHGIAVFSVAEALAVQASGRRAALILTESRPEDLEGLLAAAAVVTERGGTTSHAGVVARGLGKVCVTALADATVDGEGQRLVPASGAPVRTGDDIVVDGTTGVVYRGAPPETGKATVSGPVRLPEEVSWLLTAAQRRSGIEVRVNADTPAEAALGREYGATGVGLCRIEHMCLGRRQTILERVLMHLAGAEALEGLDALGEELRADLIEILREMDGRPVTIRLLDPPRHEFLPDIVELTAKAAAADAHGLPFPGQARLTHARRLQEQNPMLGVRGVRLAVLLPQLLRMQIRAIVTATLRLRRQGLDPRPELLIPMVATTSEVDAVRRCLDEVRADMGEPGAALLIPVGAMIETPRAALLARSLAARVDFFSVGTNDLTALSWGLSRDDADRELLPVYAELGLVESSPFGSFDVEGVGELVRCLAAEVRAVNPGISIGVCGEHGGQPVAVGFFASIGMNYVSCVPSQVPVVRLTASRAITRSAADVVSRHKEAP
jgi:pyruvate,orthophosphate dikinase